MNLSPSVYRRAAMRIFYRGRGLCCPSIQRVIDGWDQPTSLRALNHLDGFRRLFSPRNGRALYWGSPRKRSNTDARIVALLFMAEIVESEKG